MDSSDVIDDITKLKLGALDTLENATGAVIGSIGSVLSGFHKGD